MNAYYQDIRSRIKEEPTWYDANGVPRYGPFNPDMSPNIYATEVILMEISCQDCSQKFLVEMNWSSMSQMFDRHAEPFFGRMKHWLNDKDKHEHFPPIHYGDPPAHGCVGDTMNCWDLRIVEFWQKGDYRNVGEMFRWKRISEYEVELEKER